MAASGNIKLLCWTVLLLSFCYVAYGGDQALDCCLNVSKNKIPLKILVSYQIQDKEQGCKIDAVVFVTEKGRQLCAPHGAPWVKRRIAKLDAKQGSNQKKK